MCLKNKDYSLQGDFFSDTFREIEVVLKKCTGPTCKSNAEIQQGINNLDLTFIVVNAYLDFTDYNDPVKHYIDDLIFFHLESTRHKKSTVFVMKSEVDLADYLLQVGQSWVGYFSLVEKTRAFDDSFHEYDPNDDDTGKYSSIILRFDTKYYQYGRTVYTVLQFLGDVGGLQSSLLMVGAVLVSFFTHRLFLASIMKEMYYTKFERGGASSSIITQ